MHLEKLKGIANYFFFTSTESLNILHRQARGPQAARGNKLQVADIFPFSVENTWFHLNLTFLKPWANQCVFLMGMFFLNYVNETMYVLWNLPFFNGFCLRLTFFFFFSQTLGWSWLNKPVSMSIILWSGMT